MKIRSINDLYIEFLYGDGLKGDGLKGDEHPAVQKARAVYEALPQGLEKDQAGFIWATLGRQLNYPAAQWRTAYTSPISYQNRDLLLPCERPFWAAPPEPTAKSPLILVGEQGIGDQIRWSHHLMRFDPHVVTMVAEPKLLPLLRACYPAYKIVDPIAGANLEGQRVALGDMVCFDGGEVSSIQPSGFLALPDSHKAEGAKRLQSALKEAGHQGDVPLYGLCFRSMKIDTHRALHYSNAQHWEDFFNQYPGVIINLQYGLTPDELQTISAFAGGRFITVPGLDLRSDLLAYAALIANLKGVIAASTMAADLSAALGQPSYRIMPACYALSKGGPHPFYGQATRLLPYQLPADWPLVLQQVASLLNG